MLKTYQFKTQCKGDIHTVALKLQIGYHFARTRDRI